MGYKPGQINKKAYSMKYIDREETIEEVLTYPFLAIQERGITQKTCEKLGIRTAVSEKDGITPIAHYFPYHIEDKLVGFKKRDLTKPKEHDYHFTTIGYQGVKCDMFNSHNCNVSGGKMIWVTEGECFTPEAEILTTHGWVKLKDYKGDTSVLQVTSEGRGEWVLPNAVVDKIWAGKLIEYSSGSYYSLTTPDHNLIRLSKGEYKKFKAKPEEEKAGFHFLAPRVIMGYEGEDSDWKENDIRVQVMVSADFTISEDGDLYAVFTKSRKIDKCRELLLKQDVSFKERTLEDGKISFFIERGHGLKVSKLFPMELLKGKNLRLLLEECLLWDGNNLLNRNQKEYFSKELHNAVFIQTIVHMLGFTSTIIPRKNQSGTRYKVKVSFVKQTSRIRNKYTEVPYCGRVMCVTVPSGMILVRQNGSISVSGNCDAAIAYQTLKNRYPKFNPNVVSISNGTSSALKNISQRNNQKLLKKFQENIICFDADSATPEEKKKGIKKGKEALAEVYGLMPNIKVVNLPDDKDPCDVFLSDGEEQLYWLLMKPIQYTPEGFTCYSEIRDAALAPPVLGKAWPWPSFTKLTLGRRGGEGYYFGSGAKMGKSSLANKVIEHIYHNEKNQFGDPQKVAVFKFEELPEETVKKVAGSFYKVDFTNPEKRIFITEGGNEVDVYGNAIPVSGPARAGWFTEQDLVGACDAVGPRLLLYKNYGRTNWNELKGAIRHAVLVEYVEDVFIDPIIRLVQGMSASDANTELERFADEISKMAKELNFTYYCFSHLKAPEKGSHEFGAEVMSVQFHGSRAMQRSTYYMIGLQGNKHHELNIKQRNTRELVILDDRKYGRTGLVKLYYDPDTGDFVEPAQDFWVDDEVTTLAEYHAKYPEGVIPDKDKF